MLLPDYFYKNISTEQLLNISTTQRARIRKAFLEYYLKESTTKSSNKYQTISDSILSFVNGEGLDGKPEAELIDRRMSRYHKHWDRVNKHKEYGEDLVNTQSLRRFIMSILNGEEYNMPACRLAVVRDFLVAKGKISENRLYERDYENDNLYALYSEFQPRDGYFIAGVEIPEGFVISFKGNIKDAEQPNYVQIFLHRKLSGCYAGKLIFKPSDHLPSKEESAIFHDLWLFTPNGQAFGGVKNYPESNNNSFINLSEVRFEGKITYVLHLRSKNVEIPFQDHTSDDYTIHINISDAPKIEKFDIYLENIYNNNIKNVPGGKRYVKSSIGGVYMSKDKIELGNELLELVGHSLKWLNSGDRDIDLISQGADLNLVDKHGFTAIHYFVYHFRPKALDLVLQRDDVNYLIKTPEGGTQGGRYAYNVRLEDMIGPVRISYVEKLHKKTYEQAMAKGMSIEEFHGWVKSDQLRDSPESGPKGMD